ncbi:hypothetical protein GQ600_14920 [Phytophthora cactorum]|nr:hypothetical protein GQ600_14920 [Phytophthora cactorum]
MAAIPMEKWMQTRTTAKPTIHVVDEAASTRRQDVSGNEIELTNHGEQTLASGFPVTPGKDAWKGNGIAVPGPMAAIPMETWMRTRMTAKPTIHSSLALEREQLEKRKKQIDTANAVAAMNTRLSQLGLLKSVTKAASTQSKLTFPSPLKQQKDAESEAIKSPVSQVGNSTVSDCDVSSSKSSRVDKLTPSNSDAESLPAQETVHTNSDVNTDRSLKVAKSIVSSDDTDGSTPTQVNKSNGEDAGKFTDDLVSQALQKLNNDEPPHPFPVDVGVADSLSVHINGYGSHDKNNDDNCDAGKNQPNVLPQVEVDVSLSSFTSGFVASTIVEDPQQVPVDVSLSTFTSGYDTVKENVTKRNIDTKEAVRPPTVASVVVFFADNVVAGNMASGQEQINPNLLEIQNLIEALRSAIAATLKH